MDFEGDIRQHVLEHLPHVPDARLSLESESTITLIMLYLNWRNRFISRRFRRVHRSGPLVARWQTLDPSHRLALERIVVCFEQGLDLTPHLSRDVKTGFDPSQPRTKERLARPRYLDLLLNDWGIHHLHLSVEMQPDGFVQRTKSLLFAAIQPDDAYLIDVLDHESWAKQEVLDVIAREWPEARLLLAAQGTVPPSELRLSDTQRRNLRSNGYSTSFEKDGKVYIPRTGGLMSGGTAFLTWLKARYVLAEAHALERRTKERRFTPPLESDFHFKLSDDGYGVVDRRTGEFVIKRFQLIEI